MNKICIISPSLKMGGIERALVTVSNEFIRIGCEIHFVICLKGNEFYKLDDQTRIYKPDFERDNGILNKILFYPRLLCYIRRKIKLIQPDRVLVYGDLFSPITLLALIGTNHKVYISDRTIPNYKFNWPIRFLKKWLYPKSAGFIAQTKRSAEFKKNKFGDKLKISVIPNALPKLNYDVNEISYKEKFILYVGRFAWEKDPEILIRSFEIIAQDFPDWKLIMAGDGPLFSKMKILAVELGLEEKIEFLGKVKTIEKLYASASIYVLPSTVEGFPNSLIEAMAFGLPSVCFSDIPFEDIINEKRNGLVVKTRTHEALAKKIRELLEDPKMRDEIGLQAKIDVLKYSSSNISKEILNFMQLSR